MGGNYETMTFEGPWKGLELRPGAQTPQHDEISLNVDYSNGLKERRPGFSRVIEARSYDCVRASVHAHKNYVIWVGTYAQSSSDVRLLVYNVGDPTDFTDVNMTSTHGEPPASRFRCSFVDTTLLINDAMRFVTLIVCPGGTYVFDPLSLTSVFRLDPGTHSQQMNSANIGYWYDEPRGYIACEHQSRVYYAGFAPDSTAELSLALEANQALIPESFIKTGRLTIGLGPWSVVYSDEFDPAGIQAHHVFAVEERETVTGLKSFQETLVIFTDKSIYQMSGGTDAAFQITKVVAGVGCVAHGSIVEVEGVLYFMAKDGVYAFTGGAAKRISDPIQPFFHGRYSSSLVPSAMQTALTACGWPFRAAAADLPYVRGFYAAPYRQIWWSFPVQGRIAGTFPVALIWNLDAQAWGVYTIPEVAGDTEYTAGAPMYDGCVVSSDGTDRVITSSPGSLQWVQGTKDQVDASSYVGSPHVWLTAPLNKSSPATFDFRNPRFKMLCSQVTDSSPPDAVIVGERAAVDIFDTTREEESADIATHPESTRQLFWNSGVWCATGLEALVSNEMKWAPVDWFTSTVEIHVVSQSCRVGVVDYPAAAGRENAMAVQSFSLDVNQFGVRTK